MLLRARICYLGRVLVHCADVFVDFLAGHCGWLPVEEKAAHCAAGLGLGCRD